MHWPVFRHLQTDSLRLSMMIESTKLYILIPVRMTLTFIQGHSAREIEKTSVSTFSQI